MFKLGSGFWTSKTTWTGVLAVLTAVATYFAGKESLSQMEQQILIALMGVFVRDAIAKVPTFNVVHQVVPPAAVPPAAPPA